MTCDRDQMIKGRVLVIFKDGVSYKQAVRIIERCGYSVIRDAYDGYYPPLCIAVPEGQEEQAAEVFKRLPEVERACLDYNAPSPPKKRK